MWGQSPSGSSPLRRLRGTTLHSVTLAPVKNARRRTWRHGAGKKNAEGASWVHLRGAGPRWERIPTVPFPFVHGPEGAGADAGLQEDLAGLDLPVVAGVPLVPRPLDGGE